MKKSLIASGVAILAFATIAMAASYTFSNNLTVGSTGADVSALQNALIAAGYSIPSISSGAASTGYFGSQTKAAVVAYQAANGVPNTGFVGPLTRAALNGGASMSSGSSMSTCPAGYTCTANNTVTPVCPVGFTCTSNTTGAPVAGTTAGITTPGIAGSLDVSNGSYVGNGTTVNDGQSTGIASFALQSGPSDMAVNSLAIDFNVRPWLYMNSMTIADTSGKVLGSVSGLNQSNFTEITVGSDYRLTIPVNFVIPKATRYVVVLNGQFGISNRTTQNIYVTYVQTRSTDGTGVTLTGTLGNQATTGNGALGLYVDYGGQQSSSVVVTLDPNSPNQGIIQTNSGNTQTQNVLLAVYDLKSQNVNSTLQSLTVYLNSVGQTPANTFANVQLKSGSTLLSSGSLGAAVATGTPVTFNNFNLALPSNQYIPVSVYATINGGITGVTATTTIDISAANIGGIDAASNPLTVNSGGTLITSSVQTLILSGGSLSNLAWSIAPAQSVSAGLLKTTTFSGSFTVTGGNNPIYISTTPSTAFGTTTGLVGATSSLSFSPSDGAESYDVSGFYTINPGSSRTFNITGTLINGTGVTQSVGTGISTVYLTDTTGTPLKLPINFLLSGLNSDLHTKVLLGTQ